jgi:ribosomal protein S15P/S13E
VEERVYSDTIAILPADIGTLQWYTTQGYVPQKVKEVLIEAVKRRSALADAERQLNLLTQQIAALRQEQASTRANMTALDKATDGFRRFEKKLLDSETQIEKLQAQADDLRAKVEGLRKDLNDYLEKATIE